MRPPPVRGTIGGGAAPCRQKTQMERNLLDHRVLRVLYLDRRIARSFRHRSRTKGKTEAGVKYVKRNALADQTFESFAALEQYLREWMTTTADQRRHGTTKVDTDFSRLTPTSVAARYRRRRGATRDPTEGRRLVEDESSMTGATTDPGGCTCRPRRRSESSTVRTADA
jgi:hypothetical protein